MNMHYDPSVLCKHCGLRGGKHGGVNNPHRVRPCPASDADPKWPTTIKDQAKAGALYDKRLAKHWTKRTTSYEPVGA